MSKSKGKVQNESYDYDVLEFADCRLPGGSAHSTAEEIRAQASFGYSTGLMPVYGSISKRFAPFSSSLERVVREGLAEIVTPAPVVRAKIAILRNPTQFMDTSALWQKVQVDRVVLVANHQPTDADGSINYDPEIVDYNLREYFGKPIMWGPLGPAVREMLVSYSEKIHLADEDWVNVMDIDDWLSPRRGVLGDKPIIGRHSRDAKLKWPATKEVITSAYPVTDDFEVNILGGAKLAKRILGYTPESWTVHEFGSIHSKEYLRTIDFWVYYHHPDLNEAYGRAIMEALASGCVVILPTHFELSFKDSGAIFADPAQVKSIIKKIHSDHKLFLRHSKRSQAFARQYAWQLQAKRLKSLIGPPKSPRVNRSLLSRKVSEGAANHGDVILCIIVDGNNIKALNNLKRIDDDSGRYEAIVLSTSKEVALLNNYAWGYFASREELNCDIEDWLDILERRVSYYINATNPSAIIFDRKEYFEWFLARKPKSLDESSLVFAESLHYEGGSLIQVLKKSRENGNE